MSKTCWKRSTGCGKEKFSQTYPQIVFIHIPVFTGIFQDAFAGENFFPSIRFWGRLRQNRLFPISTGSITTTSCLYLYLFFIERRARWSRAMIDFLSLAYPWIKALHVMAVLAWMAGLFYLPRLFVYHAERGQEGQEPVHSFRIMEEKLLRMIMNPAMITTWAAGLALVLTPGIVDWTMIWPWTKAAAVLGMTWFHMWLAGQRKALLQGRGLSGRRYRMMNELPTLFMVVIVLSVIVKF